MQGFYTTYSKEEMPSFQVEGVEISGQDFFAALGEDLMPAAGPAASSASRSGRYNEYGGSDLLDGIDHLGRLDIGFDGGTQLATDTVEPSAPEVDIDYDVTIAAGPEAGAVDLTVYEGGLAGGSQAGQAATPTTASGSLNINAPDGVASIVIGDVVVYENGKLTGNVVTTDEGTLAVTGYDPVTGKLDFSYTLDRNTTEHDKSDPATDTQISHDLTVTVTDTDGDSDSTTITVNVVDDVPTAHADSFTLTEAQAQAGGSGANVLNNDVFGADAPADKSVTSIEGGTLGQPVDGTYGTLTLNENGTYTYTLNAGVDVPKGSTYTEEFTYTITDKDGDTSEATLTITIKGDESTPVISVPDADDAAAKVYESGLNDGGSEASTDKETTSGEITLTLNGEAATVTIGGHEFAVDADGNATIAAGGESIDTGEGTLIITGISGGKVSYTYTLKANQTHAEGLGNNTLTDEIAINVKDATGDEASGNLTITIVDDVPTISVSDISSTVIPGGGAGNLENGEAADFTKGAGGQPLGHSTSLPGWDGVTMYAAKVTYSGSGDNVQISGIDDSSDYTLKYSPYNTNHPDADKGLTVDAGNYSWWGNYDPTANHNEEISVIKDEDGKITQSEAVVFDLGGQLAYGVTIDFGAFYNGEPGATGTTQWDHVSEKALVTFYRDGQIVGSTLVEGNSSDGKFTLNSSDVVLGGFDKVVISAVDNRTEEFKDENSDFTIQGIDFITKRDDPIIINEGTVTAVSGADGFADAYTDSHAKFDLAGMVNDGTLNEGGTSGTIMVLKDGTEQPVTLELSEGSSGESILTGTLADGEQLFTATLDKDGNWTMEQYEQFRVVGEEGESNQFGLIFKTEDADGDMASTTVNVPLEVVEQTITEDGAAIGNGDDTIVIEGGEGVAGTVAAGDSGGMTEGQQVAANYNVCFVLDTSGSMDERVGNEPAWWQYDTRPTRLDIAVESIENFIDTSIHQGDFVGTVNLAVVPFASTHGDTIKVSITRVSDGQGGYTETYTLGTSSYSTYDAFSTAFHSRLNRLDANGGTNYQAGFHNAAEWFGELDNPSGADGNITYFLSDGEPTFHGTSSEGGGNYAKLEDVQGAWTGYQELLGVASGMQVNAIGFGDDLDTNAMKTLAMLDNTGTPVSGVEGNQAADGYLYYGKQGTTKWPPDTGTITNGNATQVTDGAGLTAAFTSGFNPGALVAAGDDTITAAESDSSVIIYGDVMNTDRLRYELVQNEAIAFALVAAGIDYGSGSEVFQWLEDAANAGTLKGTKFEGWTHADTVDYMLRHAEELGYETRVDDDGTFYLVTADGTVLDMDGKEATVGLDSLTGRGGGNDFIIGSQADDVIYGQEGNDLLVGDAPSESGEGSTVGSIEDTTVDSIKAMSTDDLDAFIQSVEGTDADGDDRLFGGTGDDVLLGMGGDDYIDGGEGSDAIFGGSGNDIIVYDSNDYLVSGGSGIDFMVSDDSALTLTTLLQGAGDGNGPIVDSIEVLITGKDALSLTSIQELADKYGITLGTNDAGQETLTLDMSKWTDQGDGSYDFTGGADLTLETNLEHDSGASSESDGEMAQQVFILENSNS
ncbi:Ig-like domain-containing protein [Desulfovibrio piger]|uniref:Ig-like domain-containing protein n=1 Tax=Desulfovibrio piger TaxID=901 RepID=UPI0039F44A48